MECWKQGCKNKVKSFCKCIEPSIYSCSSHLSEHVQTDSIKEHRIETFKIKINLENKNALIEELLKRSKELLDIKENLIKETYEKIQELKLSLKNELENIEKIRTNQIDLIEKICFIKKIPKLSQSPIEKLLSLDINDAKRALDELGCTFNQVNEKNKNIESNEIVFFRKNTKNAVRLNLTNLSTSEQQLGIFKDEINTPDSISSSLLPDKSIFCYGNWPITGTAFILYQNGSIKQLADGAPAAGMGAVHHDGFVYLFGGWDAAGCAWNRAEKYNLATNKWYDIYPITENLSHVSCLAGDYGIMLAGFQSSKLYLYNHRQDIYNELYTNFLINTDKVLLQSENRLFLIDSSQNIYESDPNRLNDWKNIGISQIGFSSFLMTNRVYFNGNCYFIANGSSLFKFDIKFMQLTMRQV